MSQFKTEQLQILEPETIPVPLTEWELTFIMKSMERSGDSQLDLYRKLARAMRLTW